jgi:hypothetical protein
MQRDDSRIRLARQTRGLTAAPPEPVITPSYAFSIADSTLITANYSDVAGGGMAQLGSIQVELTLDVESICLVNFLGTIYLDASKSAIYGYRLNADTAVPVGYTARNTANAPSSNGSFCVPVTLAAGTHTVRLMGSKLTANGYVLGNTNLRSGSFGVIVLGPTGS